MPNPLAIAACGLMLCLAAPAAAQTSAIPACRAATATAQDAVEMLRSLHAVAQACIASDARTAPCLEVLDFFERFDGPTFTDNLATMDRGMRAMCGVGR